MATDRNRRWWSRPPARSWLRDASWGCCRLHASRTSPSWTRDAWDGVEDTLRETKLLHRATERRNAITQPERNVDVDGGTAGLKTRTETEKDTHDTGFFFGKGLTLIPTPPESPPFKMSRLLCRRRAHVCRGRFLRECVGEQLFAHRKTCGPSLWTVSCTHLRARTGNDSSTLLPPQKHYTTKISVEIT